VVLVASGEVSQQWVAQWVARWVLLLATQYSGPAAAGETRVVLDSELRCCRRYRICVVRAELCLGEQQLH
jgi:hypothetical protein